MLFWGYQKIERFADTPLAIQQETIFKLPAGTGRVALEGLLVRDKLVRSGHWFQWLLKLEPELAEFKAGTYRFTPGMTVRQMLKLLASGKEA
ncbi:cell division protein YceG, partial [Salmonella enterica]|nr:cell division protein YceG [Salmonella enterica]